MRQARQCGALVHHHPVMSVCPSSTAIAENCLRHLTDYEAVIFVSKTAAGLFFSTLRSRSLRWPAPLRAYAVGKTTASVISSEGIAVETPQSVMTSEGLLDLPSLQQVDGKKILIVCGEGGRDLLADRLQQRGALVTRCELYRRQLETGERQAITSLIKERKIDVIIAHSGELIANLQSLVVDDCRQQLNSTPIVVPSSRVARLAQQAGFHDIVESDSAMAEAMVSAIAEWYSKQHN